MAALSGVRHVKCSYAMLQDRLTHVQALLTWKPSPLQPSKFSFEYLLLPPRSAPQDVPVWLTPHLPKHLCALLLVETYRMSQQAGISDTLNRHPFSGLLHSAGELLHTP